MTHLWAILLITFLTGLNIGLFTGLMIVKIERKNNDNE